MIGNLVVITKTHSLLFNATGKIGTVVGVGKDHLNVEINGIPQLISLYEGEYEKITPYKNKFYGDQMPETD